MSNYDGNIIGWGAVIMVQPDRTAKVINYNSTASQELQDWVDSLANIAMLSDDGGNGGSPCALLMDGTISTPSSHWGHTLLNHITDAVQISSAANTLYALLSDGTVTTVERPGASFGVGADVSGWTDVVQIDSTFSTVTGIRSDGSGLLAQSTSNNTDPYGLADAIASWSDLIQLETYSNQFVVGLQRDGTMLAAGREITTSITNPESLRINFTNWPPIIRFTTHNKGQNIAAYTAFFVAGIPADGEPVFTGYPAGGTPLSAQTPLPRRILLGYSQSGTGIWMPWTGASMFMVTRATGHPLINVGQAHPAQSQSTPIMVARPRTLRGAIPPPPPPPEPPRSAWLKRERTTILAECAPAIDAGPGGDGGGSL